MATSFGGALRQIRQQAGISQRELAGRVGLDFSYISKLENDRLPPPAADTIVDLCRAMQTDPDELLALVGKIPTGVRKMVGSNRAAQAFLREAQKVEPNDETWKTLASSLQGTPRAQTARILITDALSPQALEMLQKATDVTFDVVERPSQEELIARAPEYDAMIIRSSVKITADVLTAATRLKVIGRAGVGLDNVDLKAASLRGVIVMNTPNANTITTAEHTVALILALCRQIPQAYSVMNKGGWSRNKFMGIQLHGKTLGIIGFGRIGRHVAKLAVAFGMNVLAFDPYMNDAVARELKVTPVTMDELLVRADIITLHSVLTPETRGLINAEKIAQMKPGVRLVNAARGELVDEQALIEAVQSGHIAGLALDTYAQEPLAADSPLRTMPNVVVTPHLAASTVEAQEDAGLQVIQQVLDALSGRDFKNAVNMPIADASVFQRLRPYLLLAERLGNLQMQLNTLPVQQVEIEVSGDEIADQSKIVTIALLKGMLDTITEGPVNYINALHLAIERGIRVVESRGQSNSNYAVQISCRVRWNGGERQVVGSLLGREAPRVVQIDKFPLDANLEGIILVVESVDMPGVISRVSTLLAANGLNIAEWRLGRMAPGAQALSFVNLDVPAAQAVLQEVKKLEGVVNVTQVYL